MSRFGFHAVKEADVTSLALATWSSEGNVDSLVDVLTGALREVDEYTAEHSGETVDLAIRVARKLPLNSDETLLVARVAALHDVGKVGVPKELLVKAGPLTEDERITMETHPVVGERILGRIPELAEIASAIRHEHERWDGRGYPDGLAGEEIPFASRIVLVCDAWHAMTSDRPYQAPLGREHALRQLETNAGTQFDPVVTEALLGVLSTDLLQAA